MKKTLAILLALAFLLALAAGCTAKSQPGVSAPVTGTAQPTETPASGGEATPAVTGGGDSPTVSEGSFRYAESYEEIAALLEEYGELRNQGIFYTDDAGVSQAEATESPQGETGAGEGAGAGVSYSETNHQVEGVDEGDIVKTDGTYIYVIQDYTLVILQADGPSTRELGRVAVGENWKSTDDASGYSYSEQYPSEMYVSGDRVAVVANHYSYLERYDENGNYTYENSQYTAVDIYDVSNPSKPSLLVSLGQDGYGGSSRLSGGVLYLVSNYYVWDSDEDDPITYMPCVYEGGEKTMVAPGDVCILPRGSSTVYTVVCSYDLAGAALKDTVTVLGGGDKVYMDGDTLYIAGGRTDVTESDPYTESVYTVVDYVNRSVTDITRLDLAGGLAVTASATINGSIESQFSMDEFEGRLRVVTTANTYSYRTYTDEAMDFVNTVWGEDEKTKNNLYVLDESLAPLGGVEDLAEGERVYSARFDGSMAYFCTFEQVDPLFAVDLTDPANPKVLSALKISGFSEYLHPWTEGRLLGLGLEADENTGRTSGMKLVMFDNSDPANVTVKSSLKLSSSYSEALYNHKAVFVSYEHNLIGFVDGDTGTYLIYGYDENGGFSLRSSVSTGSWSWNARGLYIGDYVYVYLGSALYVLDMDSLTIAGSVTLSYG